MAVNTSEIPIPPSANRIWRIFGNRMHKSKDYSAWLEHTGWLLRRDLRTFTEPVAVTVTIYGGKGFSKARDIDNCLKPVLDSLRTCGVIPDDNIQFVHRVTGEYRLPESKKSDASCTVTVEEL